MSRYFLFVLEFICVMIWLAMIPIGFLAGAFFLGLESGFRWGRNL
jgi:hypothetical protein